MSCDAMAQTNIQAIWAIRAKVMGCLSTAPSIVCQWRTIQKPPTKVSHHISGSEGKSVPKPPGNSISVEIGTAANINNQIHLISTRLNQKTKAPAGNNANQGASKPMDRSPAAKTDRAKPV